MLNKLTKCCGILAMFALYFLSAPGAYAQCETAIEQYQMIVTPPLSYGNETGWRIEALDGTLIASGGADLSVGAYPDCNDGPGPTVTPVTLDSGTEYQLVFVDCYGDGWGGGSVSLYRVADLTYLFQNQAGSTDGFETSSSFTTAPAIDCPVPGCTDEFAVNYDQFATEDDGSCEFSCTQEGGFCYGNNASSTVAQVALQAPEGEMLYIEFLSGSTEAGWDYMYVYDNIDPTQGSVIYENETTGGGSVAGVLVQSTTGQISVAVFSDGSGSCTGVTSPRYITYSTSCTLEGCTDPTAVNFNSIANLDDGSCLFTGCTDDAACNYDVNAQEDDGSCLFGAATLAITDNSFADETSWKILDENNQVVAEGDGYSFGDDIFADLCLADGCYTFMLYDSFGDGMSDFPGEDGVWAITSDGYEIISGSNWTGPYPTTTVLNAGTFCLPVVAGCTDVNACNYTEGSNFDDGTCDYSCVGCMDTAAANFDPEATQQGEGSCVYCDAGTFVFNIEMTDSGNDGWEGAAYFLTDLATDEMIQGNYENAGLQLGDLAVDFVCMPLGCYTFSAGGGSAVGEIGVTLSDQFGTTYFEGSGAISTTNIDFGLTQLCAFEGCTDPYCWNYDISATIDDGSCICPPLNNAVEDAIALECGSVVNGTVANASDVEGIVGTFFGGHTINQGGAWFQYNASGTQQIFIDLCGTLDEDTGFAEGTELNDSQIHVFVEDANGDLVPVASNDESCFSHAGVSIVTDVAETYYIHVSAYGAGDGDQFRISVNCTEACTTGTPFNDDCAGALPQLNGIAFSGSTCCTNQEGGWTAGNVDYGVPALSGASTYGVWFTFNSGDFDSFDFNLVNGDGAAVSLSIYYAATNCDEVASSTVFTDGGIAGCNVTGQCAGSISQITELIPNTDYYFLVGTTEPGECGTFSFSTTGVYLGCTDEAATNYDAQATDDDGSCDYTDIVPVNDDCINALPLACNGGYEIYSMGGATEDELPSCEEETISFDGCLIANAGQWPGGTFTPTCSGDFETITSCAYAGEYSRVNVVAGNTYTFASSNPEYAITIANSTGTTVLAAGAGGQLEYVAETSEVVRAYRSILGDCEAVQSGCTTFSVACGATPPGGVWFTFEGTGELHNINTCGSVLDTQLQLFTAPSATSCDLLECTTQLDGSDALSQTSFEGCGFFDQDDASLNFISEIGVTYFVYVGTDLGNNGTYQIEMTCEEVIVGCSVDIACNYNPLANVEGECDFTSCACSDETQTAVVIEMFDGFGDGWSGGNDGSMGGYEIQDMDGNVYASGTLEEALYQVDEDNYQGAEYGIDTQCLSDGCYFFVFTTADIWAEEQSWQLTVNGMVVAGAAYTDSDNSTSFEYAFTVGDFQCGCTDDFACNFDGVAPEWMENGTCEYVTCAGCTDPENCLYDGPDFTIDDGSCCTENCVTIQMYDSASDGWDGNVLTIADLDGNVIQTATFTAGASAVDVGCLPDGCYTVSCGGGSWQSEVSWDLLGVYGGTLSGGADNDLIINFSVGGNNCIQGCSILCACNYDSAVNIPADDQCLFDGCGGCTYEDASNYDAAALSDDGSCVFEIANPCPADLNQDGSVSTADLLQFLGAFGTICE